MEEHKIETFYNSVKIELYAVVVFEIKKKFSANSGSVTDIRYESLVFFHKMTSLVFKNLRGHFRRTYAIVFNLDSVLRILVKESCFPTTSNRTKFLVTTQWSFFLKGDVRDT